MIALSTWWNSAKSESGAEILSQILEMGFQAVELDYHLTGAMLDEMKPALGSEAKAVCVHNFCPIPNILPKEMASSDAFLLSSPDREERERAVEYTIKTIELADAIDARIAICHLGYVDITDPTKKLMELYERGEKESDDFQDILQEANDKREAGQQRSLDAVFFSLDKLIRRAEKLDVLIGIENRREFRQIPNPDEIGIILSEFHGANIGYWHNTGYAQLQDNLGIADHEEFLKQFSDRMIGIHLHDVKSTKDHMIPGTGDLDLKMVSGYLSEDVVKVMQLTPEATKEEIMEGLSLLKELKIS